MTAWFGRRAGWRAAQRLLGREVSGFAVIAAALVIIAIASLYAARSHSSKHAHVFFAGPGVTGACTGAPLAAQLTAAVHDGASLIVATGSLTGRSVTGAPPAPGGAPAFYAMKLQSVRTLRGPAVASGSTDWIPGPARGTPPNPQNAALLAPGGRIFAVVWPGSPVGSTLQLVPIVGTDAVFTPYGCWDLTGLTPDNYQESTTLLTVPGNVKISGTHLQAESGIYTVPLANVERIAASA
jgi:hypothetical protein